MQEFERLISTCKALADEHPNDLVFIDDIAVSLHLANSPALSNYVETTHDGDFYISLVGLHELRESHDLVSNEQLRKHSITRGGFDFDVYGEYRSNLPVPYAQIFVGSESYDGIRVACVEHLFVLKLQALADRWGSAKGNKDIRDLARLSLINRTFRPKLVVPYLQDEHRQLLGGLATNSEITGLTLGNAKEAKYVRKQLTERINSIDQFTALE